MNKTAAYHILRVGMAITFLWIGILILKDPSVWGVYLQPWAANLLPVPIEQAMIGTAILDLLIGALLLLDLWVWIAGIVASLHLVAILVVSGINSITVRDIGLLAAMIALIRDDIPKKWWRKLVRAVKSDTPNK